MAEQYVVPVPLAPVAAPPPRRGHSRERTAAARQAGDELRDAWIWARTCIVLAVEHAERLGLPRRYGAVLWRVTDGEDTSLAGASLDEWLLALARDLQDVR